MQSPARKVAGVLVLNSDPDSHFCPGCSEQVQNWFEIHSKSNIPSKQTWVNYRGIHLVHVELVYYYHWTS